MPIVQHIKTAGIVAVGLLCLALLPNAKAETVGAEQATELLARSEALEAKCKFLTGAQHEDLSSFLARAEVALVAKTSVDTAKAVLARGRSAGQTATCSDAEHADMINVLAAATEASGAAPHRNMVADKPAATRPLILFERQPTKTYAKPALQNYASMTLRYYLERRCNNMQPSAMASFYQNIVSTHKQVVAQFGAATIAPIMAESQARAAAMSCR